MHHNHLAKISLQVNLDSIGKILWNSPQDILTRNSYFTSSPNFVKYLLRMFVSYSFPIDWFELIWCSIGVPFPDFLSSNLVPTICRFISHTYLSPSLGVSINEILQHLGSLIVVNYLIKCLLSVSLINVCLSSFY